MTKEEVRQRAAIAAMQTLVDQYNAYGVKGAAKKAVEYADALVDELFK